jgi:hypothetical protein
MPEPEVLETMTTAVVPLLELLQAATAKRK